MDESGSHHQGASSAHRPGDANVSPLAVYRHAAKADSVQQRRPNVVLIMMESMSAKFMKHFGQSETLTPFLDSLYTRSISFRNFYSAGIHTNHGLYAHLVFFSGYDETEPDERLCHSPLFGTAYRTERKRLLQPFLYDA